MTRTPLARWLSAPARLLVGIGWLLAVATAPTSSWQALCAAAAFSAMLLALCRPRPLLCAITLGSAVAMSAALTWPLFVAGDAGRAASLLVRSVSATAVAVAVGSTFSELELGAALRGLGTPRALVDVVETLLTELRLVGPLGERMALARRLRGARGFRAGGELLAGLFVLSAERAERLALGRQLRGYDERRARSQTGLAWRDVPALAIALAPALAILAIHAVPRLATH